MDYNTHQKIKNTPHIYSFLRDDSSHYKELMRNEEYLKKIDELAKEKYQLRVSDKLDKVKNKLDLIITFMDVLK